MAKTYKTQAIQKLKAATNKNTNELVNELFNHLIMICCEEDLEYIALAKSKFIASVKGF